MGTRARFSARRYAEGVSSIEYAALGSLVAVVIISAVTLLGTNVHVLFAAVAAAY